MAEVVNCLSQVVYERGQSKPAGDIVSPTDFGLLFGHYPPGSNSLIVDHVVTHAEAVSANVTLTNLPPQDLGNQGNPGHDYLRSALNITAPDGYFETYLNSGTTTVGSGHIMFVLRYAFYDSTSTLNTGSSDFSGNYFSSVGGTGNGNIPAAALSAVLNTDAHRRPLAVLSGGTASAPTLSAAYSNDAGHSFASATLGAGSDPSLLVDARRNTYRIPFYSGSALSQHSGSLQDGYVAAAGSPAAIAGLSGKYPCAAQHPTVRDYALLAYLDGTTLKTACTLDAGATWAFLAVVATGVDFSASGRPALCWLGEAAFLASDPGPALLVRKSLDRGLTWGAPVTVATAQANPNYTSAAYSGLSLLGWQGRLLLLAWTYGAAGTTLSPALWISPDLGATWAASPGALPAGLSTPSALGVLLRTAQLRLGITHYSADDTAHWLPD